MLSNTIPTSLRFEKVDFPASWAYGGFGALMPYPREKLDLAASLKPLSYEVVLRYIRNLTAVTNILTTLR